MSTKNILEIACFNLESVQIATASGADRIELCEDYKSGGISPSLETITAARSLTNLPLHVIIRPRPVDFKNSLLLSPPEEFRYNDIEIQSMLKIILACRSRGVNGIVFGALTEKKEIDIQVVKRCMESADGMSLTFHRAIDETPDLEKSFTTLIDLGVHRVLTSGGKKNATDNLHSLERLQKKFGEKITIIPGGGIRSSNFEQVLSSGCKEYHSAAITGQSELADALEIKRLKQLLTTAV